MKLYKFYKKFEDDDDIINDKLTTKEKNPLYAVTNDSEKAKQFIKERDMDKFIFIKTKMSKDEVVEFMNSNNGAVLSNYTYISYKSKYDASKYDKVKILSTWSERETISCVTDDGIMTDYDSSGNMSPMMYKKKFKKALKMLQYIEIWKLTCTHTSDDHVDPYTFGLFDDDLGYESPAVAYDEFNVFIDHFKHLFK